MGEIVTLQQFQHVEQRISLLHGHKPCALRAERGMHAHCHMHLSHVKQLPQVVELSDGRHRDAARAPGQSPRLRQHLYGGKYSVEIVHRLAHSHEHYVCEAFRFFHRKHLVDNLRCRKVAVEALASCHAERAVHAASRLRADAERGAVTVGNHHRLYIARAHAREEILHRAVGAHHSCQRLRASHLIFLLEPLAPADGNIRHLVD